MSAHWHVVEDGPQKIGTPSPEAKDTVARSVARIALRSDTLKRDVEEVPF
jgi:hypothetical protein